MQIEVTDVDIMSTYLRGVIGKANHHAPLVEAIALTVAGAIIWSKDADPITVLSRDGDLKNVLWVKIKGQRYAFSYDHSTGLIDMRLGSTQGATIKSFSNTDTAVSVLNTFAAL